MVSDGSDLEKLFTRLLRPEGFRREGRNWRRDLPELILVVNLQRSRWGASFYVNIGALVKAIRAEPWAVRDRARPRTEEAHYQIRLEQLFADISIQAPAKISPPVERMHELLDLEAARIDPAIRASELTAILEQRLIPFLRLCRDVDGLRAAIISIVRNTTGTSSVLRDHLKLPAGLLGPDSQAAPS